MMLSFRLISTDAGTTNLFNQGLRSLNNPQTHLLFYSTPFHSQDVIGVQTVDQSVQGGTSVSLL